MAEKYFTQTPPVIGPPLDFAQIAERMRGDTLGCIQSVERDAACLSVEIALR